MRLKNIFMMITVVLTAFFLVQITVIMNNNNSMKNINIALRSNIDAVLMEANIRGFSTYINGEIQEGQSALSIQKLYASYTDSVEKFGKIVSEIEKGESKRPESEISEELAAHKKTLSDALKLSGELKQYLAEQKQNITESLFHDVFDSSTLSLELDNKHVNELKEEDNKLLIYVNNITSLLIMIEMLVILATLFVVLYLIINPIKNLTETIEDISLGKLDAEVEGKERKDEIGDLARAFERTMVSLKMAMKKTGVDESKIRVAIKPQEKKITKESLLKEGLLKAKINE